MPDSFSALGATITDALFKLFVRLLATTQRLTQVLKRDGVTIISA